jgi:hypothetical protein
MVAPGYVKDNFDGAGPKDSRFGPELSRVPDLERALVTNICKECHRPCGAVWTISLKTAATTLIHLLDWDFAGIGVRAAQRIGSLLMEEAFSTANHDTDWTEPPTTQEAILERAIAKLILLGRQVSVTPEQMIELLESGLSVVDLVEFMAACNKNCPD